MKTETIIGVGALALLGYIIYVNNKTDKVEFQRVEDLTFSPTTDLNNDGYVSNADLLILLSEFGHVCDRNNNCVSDINGDGAVSVQDLVMLLADFGYSPTEALRWVQNHSVNCDSSSGICIV